MTAAPRFPLPAFAAAGLAAAAAQVLLLRELLVSAAGDETAVASGYAAWFAGIACGAAALRRSAALRAFPAAGVVAALALSAGTGVVALRLLGAAASPGPGALPGLGVVLLLASASLLPAGALAGASFVSLAIVATALRPPGPALARLYVAEAVGSLAAGVATSLLVGTLVGPLAAALLAGLLAALLLAVARLPGGRAALAAAALLALGLLAARPIDRATESVRFRALSPSASLLGAADTPHAHLLLGGGPPFELWESGVFSSSFPDPFSSETFAHLVGSLAPSPRRVLALGPVERGPLRFLLRHGVARLDLVAPDPRALAFVEDRLPPEDFRALHDARVRVVEDDPRRFLARSSGSWDLVLLSGADPVTLSRARLFTVESFRAAAARLDPRGVLVVPLRTASAALAGETAALAGSVFGALRAVFPVVRATPGPDTLLVAGFDPGAVTLDPVLLATRFGARHVAIDAFDPGLLPLLVEPVNVSRLEVALEAASRAVPASRDDRPVSLLHALARRQSETASLAGRGLGALGRLPAPFLVGLVLLPSALLAVRPLRTPARRRRAALHAVVAIVFGTAALTPGALSALPSLPSAAVLAAHAALLLAAGGATGALFPVATDLLLASGADGGEAAARFESADHLGAAASALLAGVVLVPALGMRATGLLAATLVLLAAVDAARAR